MSKIFEDAKRCNINKVLEPETEYLRAAVLKILKKARKQVRFPKNIHVFCTETDFGYGGKVNGRYFIMIPACRVRNDERMSDSEDYLLEFIYHELAHVAQWYKDGGVDTHGKGFYNTFSRICPKHLWKYEYEYKPRNAKRFLGELP